MKGFELKDKNFLPYTKIYRVLAKEKTEANSQESLDIIF